jgi:hypothetical protein
MPAAETPDETDPLVAAKQAYDQAQAAAEKARDIERQEIAEATRRARAKRAAASERAEQARTELADAIVAAATGDGVPKRKQVEIVRITGYTRVHVARLVDKARTEAQLGD